MFKPFTIAALLSFAAAPLAQAHVVMTQLKAEPKTYYVTGLRVSHGCDGSPTRELTVTIPAAVVVAKPQPKPGWTVSVEREPLAAPVKGEGGRLLRDRVKSITWRGLLPDEAFDDFGLLAQLPDATGPLYFPTVQTCEAGQNRWIDIPPEGAAWNSVPHPAPVVQVGAAVEADPMAGMHHH